jgi:hypothetical protein
MMVSVSIKHIPSTNSSRAQNSDEKNTKFLGKMLAVDLKTINLSGVNGKILCFIQSDYLF